MSKVEIGVKLGHNVSMNPEKGRIKFDELSNVVIGCAIEVHKVLGPGLLESTYERCLCRELEIKAVAFQCQTGLPLNYNGLQLECGYRIDLYFPGKLIVELKSGG